MAQERTPNKDHLRHTSVYRYAQGSSGARQPYTDDCLNFSSRNPLPETIRSCVWLVVSWHPWLHSPHGPRESCEVSYLWIHVHTHWGKTWSLCSIQYEVLRIILRWLREWEIHLHISCHQIGALVGQCATSSEWYNILKFLQVKSALSVHSCLHVSSSSFSCVTQIHE